MAESISKSRVVRRTTKTAVENSATGKTKSARRPKAATKPKAEAAAKPATQKTPAKKPTAPKAPKAAAKPVLVKSAGVVMMPAARSATVIHEQIARLAYHYWQQRGCQHGHHHEDWARAERELRTQAVKLLEKAS